MSLNYLLVFVPIAILLDQVGEKLGIGPVVIFFCSAIALIPLASLTEKATDALASYLGATWGGLLSASLGNAPEIIIGFFALKQGLVEVVKASITGSIIGNLLFGLGVSMFAGGVKNGVQKFNKVIAGMNAGLLTLAATGLIIPAVFHYSSAAVTNEISREIAVVLFIIYLASLAYTFITNRRLIDAEAIREQIEKTPEPPGGESGWSRKKALVILTIVTITLAYLSEILTSAIEPASKSLHFTAQFSGVFLLALVGNVAQVFNSISFARSDKMDLSLGVTVGSSIQVALVVAPVLVFCGFLMGHPMNLLFSRFEVIGVALAVFLIRQLISDGTSNWLEGLMLMAVYFMLAFAFYHLPGHPAQAAHVMVH